MNAFEFTLLMRKKYQNITFEEDDFEILDYDINVVLTKNYGYRYCVYVINKKKEICMLIDANMDYELALNQFNKIKSYNSKIDRNTLIILLEEYQKSNYVYICTSIDEHSTNSKLTEIQKKQLIGFFTLSGECEKLAWQFAKKQKDLNFKYKFDFEYGLFLYPKDDPKIWKSKMIEIRIKFLKHLINECFLDE